MKTLVTILTLIFVSLTAQTNNIGHLVFWKPKDGQLSQFEAGYKKHLIWHKTNNDPWSWHGWYVVSGVRYGQFADATFNHSWEDFDHPVKPTEDMADNRINVFPYGDIEFISKLYYYPQYSIDHDPSTQLKLTKLITIQANSLEKAIKVIDELKKHYNSKQIKSFRTYRSTDQNSSNQFILFLGFDNWKEYGNSEDVQEKIEEIQQKLKTNAIISINIETMIYKEDMSLTAN